MITIETLSELRLQIAAWRRVGESINLVPTLGNLHRGHLELVDHARSLGGRVVVTIFVNPLQFGESEDLNAYPRTLQADAEKLTAAGTDLLFAPPLQEVYTRSNEEQTRVEVPMLSEILCGASRPGHFMGVATIVCKLFNMVQPDLAIFGEKDRQQLMVIRRMVADLSLPVRIQSHPTVREADGLALSSRNSYLTPEERQQAPALYRTLRATVEAIDKGRRDYSTLEQEAELALKAAGLLPDYFSIRRAEDLIEATKDDTALAVLAAAYLGKARLIDNLVSGVGLESLSENKSRSEGRPF